MRRQLSNWITELIRHTNVSTGDSDTMISGLKCPACVKKSVNLLEYPESSYILDRQTSLSMQ